MIMLSRPNMAIALSSVDSVVLSHESDDTLAVSVTTKGGGYHLDVYMTSKEARAFISSLFEAGVLSMREFEIFNDVIETAQNEMSR